MDMAGCSEDQVKKIARFYESIARNTFKKPSVEEVLFEEGHPAVREHYTTLREKAALAKERAVAKTKAQGDLQPEDDAAADAAGSKRRRKSEAADAIDPQWQLQHKAAFAAVGKPYPPT
eukprot:9131438-Alexandrium_andersonii.AAC.1